MKKRKFLLALVWFYIIGLQFSCYTPVNTAAGYYQGTFTSTNATHPSGIARVNISENGNQVDMTLEAVDWMVVHVYHVNVATNKDFPFDLKFSLNSTEQISGYMDVIGGNIGITYSNQQGIVLSIHASK
jgi:hypothetical protein